MFFIQVVRGHPGGRLQFSGDEDEDGLASICILIHSCKMPRESETTGLNDGWKWWLVGNAMDVGISDIHAQCPLVCNNLLIVIVSSVLAVDTLVVI